MRYRRVPSLDWEVSVLGLGASLAPGSSTVGSAAPNPPAAAEPTVRGHGRSAGLAPAGAADYVAMFRAAIDRGVNYLDLGWFSGMESCAPWLETVGAVLADGYRERVRVAANVPPALAASRAGWARFLDEIAAGLGIDSIDFCVVGGVTREAWPRLVAAGLPLWADSVVEEGPVDALGFFISDDLQVMKRALADYSGWSLCKMRFGFWDHLLSRPGPTGVNYAAGHGLVVVAAEPTRGAFAWRDGVGDATADTSPDAAHLEGPMEDWSLRWTWDDPWVSTVVCDPVSPAALAHYLELADRAEPRTLSVRDLTALNRARDHYVKARPASCPACRTCMPCPEDIDIPRVLDLCNDASVYGGVESARATYQMEGQRAADCTACGLCEEACPRDVPIISQLERAREFFE